LPDGLAENPELSVIIVNWNTRDLTLECLRSVYAETISTKFEVILVDNGSHDGSAAAISSEFPQVTLLAETQNHGFGMANNMAAERAQGRHLLLLNSDTLVLDRAIDRLVGFARNHPNARIWGGRTIFPDGSLNPGSAWGRITMWSSISFALGFVKAFPDSAFFNPEGIGGWRRDTVREVDIVSGCFFLIEKDLWDRLAGFDPAFFMYGEEADLCGRASRLGARPAVTPSATIVHYGGASTPHAPNKMVYLFGSKIGLAKRHLPVISAQIAQFFLVAAVAWRAFAYSAVAALSPRYARAAAGWRETWARRRQWWRGPLRTAIEERRGEVA
jgi:GT2 family glycosyltransferase